MRKAEEKLLFSLRKSGNQVRRIDMHAHLFCISKAEKESAGYLRQLSLEAEEELEERKRMGIFTCFSAGTPEEWKFLQQWREREELLLSFGIHPWYAD